PDAICEPLVPTAERPIRGSLARGYQRKWPFRRLAADPSVVTKPAAVAKRGSSPIINRPVDDRRAPAYVLINQPVDVRSRGGLISYRGFSQRWPIRRGAIWSRN